MSKSPTPKHILFLDGECLFCQKSARLLHRWDRSGQIYFSTLQGQTAEMLPDDWKVLTDQSGRPAGTAVLVECAGQTEERRWRSADAILAALRLTRSPLSFCWMFHYAPSFINNGIYRWIARNRHRLAFGNKTCPLPGQEFKAKLLP